MDFSFMKALDQTVREIKREVNLKVLKVPEIEQKVHDATNDEPWGPHGSDLADIARATKKFSECQMIMNVLWQRLSATDANWRHVYKALAVIEYLLANGSERAVDDILDNSSQIAKLSRFEFVEPNGKDVGLNVRKKAETVLAIVDDKEKLQQVREKAAATRDKYFGLSSTGITYKSSGASFSSSSYSSADRYGSMSSSREADSFKDSYRDTEWDGKGTNAKYSSKSNQKSKGTTTNETNSNKLKKGVPHGRRSQDSSPSNPKALSKPSPSPGTQTATQNIEDDFDDFDPRGSSTPGTANTSSNQVGLFGQSLMDDLIDAPTSNSTVTATSSNVAAPEVDLFADATFQSATTQVEATMASNAQNDTDLFAGQPAFPAFTSDTEFSVGASPNKSSEEKPSVSEHNSDKVFDPFAAIPLSNFQGSDPFGDFSSNLGSTTTEPSHLSTGGINSSGQSPLEEVDFGGFTSHTESPTSANTQSINKSPNNLEKTSMSVSKPVVKKETFQVKSGIWADTLSRGLIDLNITAPKKVNLSDIGIVGDLSDGAEEEKGPPAQSYMGRAMGMGSGLGRSGFPSSTGTGGSGSLPSLGQQQFGSFK